MAMTDLLNAGDIEKAMEAVAAPDSFNHDKFFEMTGMKKMQREQISKVFNLLDTNQDGFLDRKEIQVFLQRFKSGSRVLTDRETNDFLKAGDKDGDGKIGSTEFIALVRL